MFNDLGIWFSGRMFVSTEDICNIDPESQGNDEVTM